MVRRTRVPVVSPRAGRQGRRLVLQVGPQDDPGPAGRDNARWLRPVAVLAGVVVVAFLFRERGRPGHGHHQPTTSGPAGPAESPGRAHLPGDDLEHDGMHGTQLQMVLLQGGPGDKARVAVPWTQPDYQLLDEQQQRHLYRDSGLTSSSPTGAAMRVFDHAEK